MAAKTPTEELIEVYGLLIEMAAIVTQSSMYKRQQSRAAALIAKAEKRLEKLEQEVPDGR